MLDNIYYYVIPLILFFTFLYVIFLIFNRKNYLYQIEQDFNQTINHAFNLLDNNFNVFVKKIDKKTEMVLSDFVEANEEQLKDITIQIKNLNEQLQQMQENQKKINNINFELSQNISHLNNEIKKRDAIIERKTKQIKRLKNEI